MTFMNFSKNLAERLVQVLLKGYFLIAFPESMVRSDRYLRCVYTSGVLVKVLFMRQNTSIFCDLSRNNPKSQAYLIALSKPRHGTHLAKTHCLNLQWY
jgi:hypothetical protein